MPRTPSPRSRTPIYRPSASAKSLQKRRKQIRTTQLKACLYIALVILGVGLIAKANSVMSAKRANTPTASEIAEAAARESTRLKTEKMSQTISEILEQYKGMEISVAITDLKYGDSFTYGEQAAYAAASTTKLLSASTLLHEVEQGNQELDQNINGYTLGELLQLLIEQSNNDAWQAIDSQLSRPVVQSWATSNGLQTFNVQSNIVSAQDITLLLTKLYTEKLLNTEHTQLLLRYMKNANYTELIPAAVPNDINVYHKAGYLEDRIHDAAIIDNGAHPYAISIFTKSNGLYDSSTEIKAIHEITQASLGAFTT